MRARTKKPRTEDKAGAVHESRVVLYGPKKKESALLKSAKGLGFAAVPWREAFSEYSKEELPGTVLRGARSKEGLTQKQLSEKLGITQGNLSEMESGKRPIGRNMAKRLALVLNVDYKIFL